MTYAFGACETANFYRNRYFKMIGAEFVCLFTGEWGEWLILGCPSPVKADGQRVFGGGE